MLLIVLLILLDGFFISGIKVEKIEWHDFLPKTITNVQMDNVLLDKKKQYLFCHTKDRQKIDKLKKEGLLQEYFAVSLVDDTYILLFDADKMSLVLEKTKNFQRSGTALVGNMVFEDFYDEIMDYTFTIVPILLILLLLLIPLRLWIDILLEMALYTLLLTLVLRLGIIQINSASLLSLVFLIIYSLTLINYLYSEGMNFKRLFFGIQISIVATMVSALFLIYCNHSAPNKKIGTKIA